MPLFQPASFGEWQQNAVVGGEYLDHNAYIIGFYRAAEALVKVALEEHRNDVLFFPICFTYRHWLELILKQLIKQSTSYCKVLFEIGEIAQNPPELRYGLPPATHNLLKLLTNLKILTSQVKLVDLNTDIEAIIIQLNQFDSDGQTFRYAYRQDGSPTLDKQELYDLVQIYNEMKKVYNYLSGLDAYLDYTIQQAKDYIREMKNFYWDM
jgi:hypothetical protein